MVIIIVMVVSCAVLVGISYFMLDILSGMVVAPRTPVEEVAGEGELVLPLAGGGVASLQVSGDGRFVAYLQEGEGGADDSLNVCELSDGCSLAFSQAVKGEHIAWLGSGASLLYEDAGDIFLLDVEAGTRRNLTASAELDMEPLPSPDGRRVLWTRAPVGGAAGKPEFWVMDADGSGKAPLAERQDLAAWDPAGEKVISRFRSYPTTLEDTPAYYLQIAVPGGGGWNYYTECEGEVSFIWWPREDEILYLSPLSMRGEDTVRGVWFRVEEPGSLKKVASTDGLGVEEAFYRFYPSREGERMAYVGERGLEYLDYGDRVVRRLTGVEARTPLAWNEAGGEIFYCRPDGIYRVAVGGD